MTLSESNRRNGHQEFYHETDSSFKQELLTSEHIPFAVNLFNAIEDVRRGMAHNPDCGLQALEALYHALPSKLRQKVYKQLPNLLQDIEQYGRMQKHIWYSRSFHGGSYESTDLDWNAELSVYQPKTITKPIVRVIRHRHVTKNYVYSATARRKFVGEMLEAIIDILEGEGILWKSRLELIGGNT